MKSRGCLYRLLTTAALSGLATPALAQVAEKQPVGTSVPPGEGTRASEPSALEDIVVTGERNNQYGTDVVQAGSFRGAKAIDTPLTISVIPSAILQSQQAIDLIDAVRNTPGVSSSSVGPVAYNNITIRGIAVDTRSNYKLDGTLNILSSIAFPLEDKDRVEVLKGASALYYGFSTPSGIVNLTMKRPTPQFSLYENTFFDAHGGIGAHVDVGDTFGPLGFRLNGVLAHIDTGIDFSKGKRHLIAGAFDLKPVRGLTLTLDVEDFARDVVEPGSFRYFTLPTPTPANPYPALPIPPLNRLNPARNFSYSWTNNHAYETNILGKAAYRIGRSWTISAAWGRSKLHRVRYTPQVNPTDINTGAGTLFLSPQDSRFKTTNYSAELAGTIRLGILRNEILLGYGSRVNDTHTPAPTRVSFAQNFYSPTNISFRTLVFNQVGDTTRIDDKGVYFFDRLSIKDGLVQLLGGIRKSDYVESNVTTGVTTFSAKPTSYSVGAVVKPVEWASAYATYIEGLETTPAAPLTAVNAAQQLPPSKSTQREIGFKLQPKRDILFQASYFDIKRGSAYVNGSNVYVVDGEARYRGIELSLNGNITPDLSLIAGYTHLTARQISGAPTVTTPRFSPTLVGLLIEGTPRVTWSLAGEYALSWLAEGVKVTGGVYHVGRQAVNALNEAFVPAYTTFDVGASYAFDIQGHAMVARVSGQNITNKRYWAAVGASTFSESLPANVKFSLSFRY